MEFYTSISNLKVGAEKQQAEGLWVMWNRQGREPGTPVDSTTAFDNTVKSLLKKKKKKEKKRE